MDNSFDIKICGLRDASSVTVACDGGATMVGFVFFPPSPRAVTLVQAVELARTVPDHVTRVGLVVDGDDALLQSLAGSGAVDMLQLHGAETPARVADVRARFGLPVMKVVGIADGTDVARARDFENVADRLLFDARPPKDATLPGGNAVMFDWTLLAGQSWVCPWMLAGGLNADNVADAIRISGACGVDVSSGVEDAPGVKSEAKIRAFLAAVAQARGA